MRDSISQRKFAYLWLCAFAISKRLRRYHSRTIYIPLTSAVSRLASFRSVFFFLFFLAEAFTQFRFYLYFIFYKQSFAAFPAFGRIASCFLGLPPSLPLTLPHTLRCFVSFTAWRVWVMRCSVFISAFPRRLCSCHARHYGRFPFPFANLYRNCWANGWLGATLRCSGCDSCCWCSCSMLLQRAIQGWKGYKVVALQVSAVAAVSVVTAVMSAFQSLLQPHFIAPSGYNYFNFMWQQCALSSL